MPSGTDFCYFPLPGIFIRRLGNTSYVNSVNFRFAGMFCSLLPRLFKGQFTRHEWRRGKAQERGGRSVG